MNISFVANPVTLRTIVYSTLGGGCAYLSAEGTPLFSLSVLNTVDTSTSSGFKELFQNGVTLAGETRLPVDLLGLPGHQMFGATYSTGDYVSHTQDPRLLIPGGNVPSARKDGSWSAYWNFDQYLISDLNSRCRERPPRTPNTSHRSPCLQFSLVCASPWIRRAA